MTKITKEQVLKIAQLSHIQVHDDEIDSLKSQILFLKNKGYEVTPLSNGYDALELLKEKIVDVVLLDESMPGHSIETPHSTTVTISEERVLPWSTA